MAYRVEWSPRAIHDVESIAEYISRDSTAYAAAVVRNIIAVTRTLARFPLAGRMVPELEDDALRERFVYSYRIIYRVEKHTVIITAVIHGRQMLPSIETE
jgi:addiction module RelE/StbE family toxin